MRSREKINDAKYNLCHVFFICLFLESKRTVKRKNHGGTRHEKNIVRANRALTRCLFYSCVNSGVFSLNKTAVVARTWLIEGNLIVLDESSYEYFHFPPESENKQWFSLEEDNFANKSQRYYIHRYIANQKSNCALFILNILLENCIFYHFSCYKYM